MTMGGGGPPKEKQARDRKSATHGMHMLAGAGARDGIGEGRGEVKCANHAGLCMPRTGRAVTPWGLVCSVQLELRQSST